MTDYIVIDSLEIQSRVGITAEERATPQRLTVTLVMEPIRQLSGLNDDIENTVDYYEVAQVVKAAAASGERNLIETLAEDICSVVLGGFQVASVDLELRKYVMKDTAHVAIRMHRPMQGGPAER
jgi:dihydroneopterin aldolase